MVVIQQLHRISFLKLTSYRSTLSNIRCVLVTKNNETAYEMTYYVEKKDGKAPKFYSRMAKLHPDERLFITGICGKFWLE